MSVGGKNGPRWGPFSLRRLLLPTRLAQIRREPLATAHSSGRVAADPHRAQAQDSCGVAKVESHQTRTDDADSSLEVISV